MLSKHSNISNNFCEFILKQPCRSPLSLCILFLDDGTACCRSL